MDELIKSKATLSFHLDGKSEIDAVVLSKMISDMAELTKAVAQEVNPDAYLKMNVTAFKNGSFQIDFSAICEAAQTVFCALPSAVSLAGATILAVKGIFEIKKLIRDGKPKKVERLDDKSIKIEAKDGGTVIVPKESGAIISSVRIDQLVVNIASNVKEHNSSGGFSISTNDEASYYAAEDVSGMSRPLPIEEITTCRRERVNAVLPIRKAVLRGTSQWNFDFNDRAIDATILDDAFINEVHRGTPVTSGDYIKATIEIYTDLDIMGKPIKGTEKYTVIKVHGGLRHQYDDQNKLDDV